MSNEAVPAPVPVHAPVVVKSRACWKTSAISSDRITSNFYMLIIRVRHNVIKTAIRSIGVLHSSISLGGLPEKLVLNSSEDAEFIVSKAFLNVVVEATIDLDKVFLKKMESTDIYSTWEPRLAFHHLHQISTRRI